MNKGLSTPGLQDKMMRGGDIPGHSWPVMGSLSPFRLRKEAQSWAVAKGSRVDRVQTLFHPRRHWLCSRNTFQQSLRLQ